MKQVIIQRIPILKNNNQTTTPFYFAIRGGPFPLVQGGGDPHPDVQGSSPWSVPGTFTKLRAAFTVPAYFPFGVTWVASTVELYKNGVATGLVANLASGSSTPGTESIAADTDTTTTVTVAAGDRVQFVLLGGSNSSLNGRCMDLVTAVTFTSTNTGESGYSCGGYNTYTPHPLNPAYGAPLNGQYAPFGYDDVARHSIMPLQGAIFRYDVKLSVAPGTGESQNFVWLLNGVVQDGSGGTVNTALSITDAATTGHATFTLPVVRTDLVSVRLLSSTSAATTNYTYSCGLRAAIDGQYALCCDTANGAPNFSVPVGTADYAGVNQYNSWADSSALAPTPPGPPSPEAAWYVPGGLDGFILLNGLIAEVSPAPGSGSYTFTTRKNLASPVGTSTLTVGPTDTLVQTGIGSVGINSASDVLDLMCVNAGTPVGVHTGWTWLVSGQSSPEPPTTETRVIRIMRRFSLPSQGNLMQFLSRLEIEFQAGVGLPTGQGSDPVLMCRISRDGGQTWGAELQMGMGAMGAYQQRAYLNRLGRGRNFVVELTSTDPVPVVLLSALVDLEAGTS